MELKEILLTALTFFAVVMIIGGIILWRNTQERDDDPS